MQLVTVEFGVQYMGIELEYVPGVPCDKAVVLGDDSGKRVEVLLNPQDPPESGLDRPKIIARAMLVKHTPKDVTEDDIFWSLKRENEVDDRLLVRFRTESDDTESLSKESISGLIEVIEGSPIEVTQGTGIDENPHEEQEEEDIKLTSEDVLMIMKLGDVVHYRMNGCEHQGYVYGIESGTLKSARYEDYMKENEWAERFSSSTAEEI